MIDDQLRTRLTASAETFDHAPVPLDEIRRDGRSIQRRRTRLRVAGVGAAAAAVAAVALVVPGLGLGSGADGTDPATVPPSDVPSFPPDENLPQLYAEVLVPADSVQRQALADDEVTRAEYRTGFERYRSCVVDAGQQLGSVDLLGDIIQYTVPAATVDSGVDTPCYERHFRVVDMIWQGDQAEVDDDPSPRP